MFSFGDLYIAMTVQLNHTTDFFVIRPISALQWRYNEHDGVSNHQPHYCLLNRLFKLRVTGLCEGNSPVTGEYPHKGPVMRIMFPFDDVIMRLHISMAVTPLKTHWCYCSIALNHRYVLYVIDGSSFYSDDALCIIQCRPHGRVDVLASQLYL